jgi:hypothetical protein
MSRLLVYSLAIHLFDEDADLLSTCITKDIIEVRSLLPAEEAAMTIPMIHTAHDGPSHVNVNRVAENEPRDDMTSLGHMIEHHLNHAPRNPSNDTIPEEPRGRRDSRPSRTQSFYGATTEKRCAVSSVQRASSTSSSFSFMIRFHHEQSGGIHTKEWILKCETCGRSSYRYHRYTYTYIGRHARYVFCIYLYRYIDRYLSASYLMHMHDM